MAVLVDNQTGSDRQESAQIRERMWSPCSTGADAYLKPLLSGYCRRVVAAQRQRRVSGPCSLLKSDGGTTGLVEAPARPVDSAALGLTGGVIGGARVAREAGLAQAITFDMRGTSCDVGLLLEFGPRSHGCGWSGCRPWAWVTRRWTSGSGRALQRFAAGRAARAPRLSMRYAYRNYEWHVEYRFGGRVARGGRPLPPPPRGFPWPPDPRSPSERFSRRR